MAFNWTPVINGNVTAQRVSKRVKSVGGAFLTTGFTPANDMGTGVSSCTTTVTANVVYEAKLENICAIGGPTMSAEGIIEGIVFECPDLIISADGNSILVDTDLTGTDITKVRYTLRKSSDNSIVGGPITIVRASNAAPHTFIGLADATNYYVDFFLLANVDGVEVDSSEDGYLNAPCGGNNVGSQITTENAACIGYSISNDSEITDDAGYDDCSDGTPVAFTLDPTESAAICARAGTVVAPNMNQPGGWNVVDTGTCSLFLLENGTPPIENVVINSVTPAFYLVFSGAFPLVGEDKIFSTHAGTASAITVNISNPDNTPNLNVKLYKNDIFQECINVGNGTADYTFAAVTFIPGDRIRIFLFDDGACV